MTTAMDTTDESCLSRMQDLRTVLELQPLDVVVGKNRVHKFRQANIQVKLFICQYLEKHTDEFFACWGSQNVEDQNLFHTQLLKAQLRHGFRFVEEKSLDHNDVVDGFSSSSSVTTNMSKCPSLCSSSIASSSTTSSLSSSRSMVIWRLVFIERMVRFNTGRIRNLLDRMKKMSLQQVDDSQQQEQEEEQQQYDDDEICFPSDIRELSRSDVQHYVTDLNLRLGKLCKMMQQEIVGPCAFRKLKLKPPRALDEDGDSYEDN